MLGCLCLGLRNDGIRGRFRVRVGVRMTDVR